MKKTYYFVFNAKIVKTLLILFLLFLPFTGSDCEKVLVNPPPGSGDIRGQWRLVYNAGTNHDICPGETINFGNDGQASLKCPDQLPITRQYSVSNNELTYTETGVVYDIAVLTESELQLSGNNRYLYYLRTAISDDNNSGNNKSDNRNSSEK